MRLTTWNVLHRVHAANWSEPITIDEPERIARIADRVAAMDGIVCMQEVSGDQLEVLRARGPLVSLRYPRVPKLRRGEAKLTDRTEHLVVVGARERVGGAPFSNDGGKGWLAVDAGDWIVVCTHVTWGKGGVPQLAKLAEHAGAANKPIAIAGDFNAEADVVAAAFGEGFTISHAPLPTRPPDQRIDHIVVRGGRVLDVEVADAAGLSDHALVSARLE